MDVTIGSLAFWKVFLGCMWLAGVVAMGLTGGYLSAVVMSFGPDEGSPRHSTAVNVATVLWPLFLVVDAVIMIVFLGALITGQFGSMFVNDQ